MTPSRKDWRTTSLFGRIALGALLAGTNPLTAQLPARFAERVDVYVAQQMAQQKLVGLSLAVMLGYNNGGSRGAGI